MFKASTPHTQKHILYSTSIAIIYYLAEFSKY